jgi:hypothetical protein
MINLLFFIKFIIAVGTVVLLSDLFERINPRIAGVLSGYPIGVALSLFFFGLENGAKFASRSALFNIVGIISFLTFIGIYYLSSRVFTKFTLIISTFLATLGFLIISYVLQQIRFTLISGVILAIISIVVWSVYFNKIRKMQTGIDVKVTFKSIFIKAIVAGLIITGVTTIAGFVGPAWAGLLASFPATTLPLILMVHRKYSTMHLHAFLKYIPVGSFSIVAYVIAVYYFYPRVGIYFGTVIAYGVATLFIFLYFFTEKSSIIKKLREGFHMTDQSTIHFIITGGTIDFHFERRHDTIVANTKSIIPEFIKTLDYLNSEFTELFIKDSRTLSETDYKKILQTIEKSPYSKIIVTTGTFKIDELAKFIDENTINNTKTIILTGSTTPIEGFTPSEGLFNLGHAVACAQRMGKGVYISFNGELFTKNEIDRLIREGGLAAIFQISTHSPLIR